METRPACWEGWASLPHFEAFLRQITAQLVHRVTEDIAIGGVGHRALFKLSECQQRGVTGVTAEPTSTGFWQLRKRGNGIT